MLTGLVQQTKPATGLNWTAGNLLLVRTTLNLSVNMAAPALARWSRLGNLANRTIPDHVIRPLFA